MVLAAKPQFALLGNPHRSGCLRDAALPVLSLGDKLDFAILLQLRRTQQQAARIGLARADNAQVLGLLLVVVAVKAPHHPLAHRSSNASDGAHLQRHTSRRLAVRRQRQCLVAQLLAGRGPALGLDTGHHGCRPQRAEARQGLDLAIGVGEIGFDHQILRGGRCWHIAQYHLAGSVGIQGERQFIGHNAAVVASGDLGRVVLSRNVAFFLRGRK